MAAEYVEGPALSTLFPGTVSTFSGQCWYKTNEAVPPNFDTLVGSSSNWSTWGDGFGVYFDTGPSLRFWVNTFSGRFVTSPTLSNLNTAWHHMAYATDGSTLYLWTDGVLSTAAVGFQNLNTTGTQNFRAGSTGNIQPSNYYNGRVAEVATWNGYLLTNADATALRRRRVRLTNEAMMPNPAALNLYWRFDLATDDPTINTGSVRDYSLTGSTGTFRTAASGVGIIDETDIPTPVKNIDQERRNAARYFQGAF